MRKIYSIILLFLSIIFSKNLEICGANAIDNFSNYSKEDILKGLDEQREYYYTLYVNTTNTNDKEKIVKIISVIENMIDFKKNNNYLNKGFFPDFFLFDSVICVNAYFNSNGYILSSELLLQSLNNEVIDSEYVPIEEHIKVIKETSIFWEIIDGRNTKGDALFDYSDKKEFQDLCYAIHNFSYIKPFPNSQSMIIHDRYDYNLDTYGWNSIEGVMVNTMAKAQEAGVINPFILNLEFEVPCEFEFESKTNFYHSYKCKHCDLIKEERHTFKQHNMGMICLLCGYFTLGNVSIEK